MKSVLKKVITRATPGKSLVKLYRENVGGWLVRIKNLSWLAFLAEASKNHTPYSESIAKIIGISPKGASLNQSSFGMIVSYLLFDLFNANVNLVFSEGVVRLLSEIFFCRLCFFNQTFATSFYLLDHCIFLSAS